MENRAVHTRVDREHSKAIWERARGRYSPQGHDPRDLLPPTQLFLPQFYHLPNSIQILNPSMDKTSRWVRNFMI
jgi:hypothetical protein